MEAPELGKRMMKTRLVGRGIVVHLRLNYQDLVVLSHVLMMNLTMKTTRKKRMMIRFEAVLELVADLGSGVDLDPGTGNWTL